MPTILIVDDSEVCIALLIRLLPDYEIHSATNGKTGIKKALDIQPDLILMDMHMPVMDGFKAVRNLREQGYKGLIIACTSCRDHSDILDAGCDHVIEKPVSPDEFPSKIRDYVTK